MSSSGEKTEQPSDKRLKDARKKGQVAKSQDLSSAVLLIGAVGMIWLIGGFIGGILQASVKEQIEFAATFKGDLTDEIAFSALWRGMTAMFWVLSPLFVVVTVFAFLSNYLQIGSVFSFESISPKFSNVAEREFHSIRLAEWLEKELKLDYALRIKGGTYIEFDGEMLKTSELAVKGESFQMSDVKITKDVELDYRTNLTVHWAADEEEPWVLATNLDVEESIEVYAKRFWIEEMFSDHKSRGLNLEKTRLTDANRLQKLLVAVTIAYLWLMEIGFSVVSAGNPKQVDNKGAERSVSLCQIGLRWLRELLNDGLSPPLFTVNFGAIGMA